MGEEVKKEKQENVLNEDEEKKGPAGSRMENISVDSREDIKMASKLATRLDLVE